jgi:hypothetical protein
MEGEAPAEPKKLGLMARLGRSLALHAMRI